MQSCARLPMVSLDESGGFPQNRRAPSLGSDRLFDSYVP